MAPPRLQFLPVLPLQRPAVRLAPRQWRMGGSSSPAPGITVCLHIAAGSAAPPQRGTRFGRVLSRNRDCLALVSRRQPAPVFDNADLTQASVIHWPSQLRCSPGANSHRRLIAQPSQL